MPMTNSLFFLALSLPLICNSALATDTLNGQKLFFEADQRLRIDIGEGLYSPAGVNSGNQSRSTESDENARHHQGLTLTFDGFLSSGVDKILWINGMPLRAERLPVGILSISWQEASGRLVVLLDNGSKHQLLPGDSMSYENADSANFSRPKVHQ